MDLVTLFASTQRALFNIDERLLFQVTAKEYALALTHHLLHEGPEPKRRLDHIFEHGGFKTCARLRAWFLSTGCCSMGNVAGSVPIMTRAEFNAVLGIGRNKASELFRIPRD
ncbi:hypothetical protein G6M84_12050 [Agrobacterium tumefaciens]|uniref:hypothetical protein n=1 Tax=Agrobacterium tumefaciens TaxID=358 RepID=UPI001573CCD8|nr:hypothetical protein [Agrobacterium tumefaciens]NTB97238.1 hypothetical protein [Agrobacterium tumefaciens]NTC43411.1 hypothetical protein [Agrobacterium tumefaciens]